jgi:hypothetical protein
MASQTPLHKEPSAGDSAPSSRGARGTATGTPSNQPVTTIIPRQKHPEKTYPVATTHEITDEERAEILSQKQLQREQTIKKGSALGKPASTQEYLRGEPVADKSEYQDPPPINFSEMANVERYFKDALDTLESTEPRVFYCDIAGVRIRTTKTKFVVELYDEKTGRGGAAKGFGEAGMYAKKPSRLGNFFPVGPGI